MKYLIVQDWPSTHGNHAGMLHMCNLLKEKYPNDYKVIVSECLPNIPWDGPVGIRQWNRIRHYIYEKYIYPHHLISLCRNPLKALKDGDEVFLLEYLFPETSQLELALYIRKHYPFVRLYALTHLTPSYAETKYSDYAGMIEKWSQPIDKMLTLGSSLSQYFEQQGMPQSKISTGFHYVDREYYHSNEKTERKSQIRIITIGAMARNLKLLAEIVAATPDVEWVICKGRKKVDSLFSKRENIHLLGFMEEDELRHQMSISDVSLSVMNDTIGSNVITTSLSMGLAQIVSNVGSIGDYCTTKNSIFCENNAKDFICAINKLRNDPALLASMKEDAVEQAKNYYIENVNLWFSSLKN